MSRAIKCMFTTHNACSITNGGASPLHQEKVLHVDMDISCQHGILKKIPCWHEMSHVDMGVNMDNSHVNMAGIFSQHEIFPCQHGIFFPTWHFEKNPMLTWDFPIFFFPCWHEIVLCQHGIFFPTWHFGKIPCWHEIFPCQHGIFFPMLTWDFLMSTWDFFAQHGILEKSHVDMRFFHVNMWFFFPTCMFTCVTCMLQISTCMLHM